MRLVTPDGEPVDREDPGRHYYRHRDPDVLRELHHEDSLTVAEVAEELGVGFNTVRKQMEHHGIERLGEARDGRPYPSGFKDQRYGSGVRDPANDPPMRPRECPECGEMHVSPEAEQACIRERARELADELSGEVSPDG